MKVGQMTHGVEAECLGVAFEGLGVVLLALVDEAEDVPADVRCQVQPDALLDEIGALLSPAHVGDYEALHAHRF